jgi:hypothetical protein
MNDVCLLQLSSHSHFFVSRFPFEDDFSSRKAVSRYIIPLLPRRLLQGNFERERERERERKHSWFTYNKSNVAGKYLKFYLVKTSLSFHSSFLAVVFKHKKQKRGEDDL